MITKAEILAGLEALAKELGSAALEVAETELGNYLGTLKSHLDVFRTKIATIPDPRETSAPAPAPAAK